MALKDTVLEAVGKVIDPELMMSLKDLGLIYGIKEENGKVTITMTLTTPACPLGPMLVNQVKQAALRVEGVKEAEVKLVFSPKWDPRKMASSKAKLALGIF